MESWKDFLAISGGATVLAYSLFVWLGKKWLEQKFAKELEDFKLRATTLFNRVSKIHDLELDILPKAWRLLVDLHSQVNRAVNPIKFYPGLESMNEGEFTSFISESNLVERDKKALRNSSDRLTSYKKIIFNHDMKDAYNRFVEFHDFIRKNKIFLSKDLYELFSELDKILYDSLFDVRINDMFDNYQFSVEAFDKIRKDVPPLLKKLEENVQRRLHFTEA